MASILASSSVNMASFWRQMASMWRQVAFLALNAGMNKKGLYCAAFILRSQSLILIVICLYMKSIIETPGLGLDRRQSASVQRRESVLK